MLQKVCLSNGTLNVRDEGHGEPILFVHGFPLSHQMWEAQIAALSSRYRCIAPDLRGFGESTVTPGFVGMDQMATDLSALLVALQVESPVTLCGLSMGGYVAWQFWKLHRGQLGRLILCDTRAIADTPEAREQRWQAAERVERDGPGFLADAMLPRLYCQATRTGRPGLVEAARQQIEHNPPQGIAAAARGMAIRPDVTDWLPEIQVPALLITGEEDAISSVGEMKSIAEALPRARQVVIAQAGHMAPEEQPDAVNAAILEFLQQ
jgi:pimeloyl-ACP methyl ester carboxylesterase